MRDDNLKRADRKYMYCVKLITYERIGAYMHQTAFMIEIAGGHETEIALLFFFLVSRRVSFRHTSSAHGMLFSRQILPPDSRKDFDNNDK